jgi:glycosyltransferase involved in cell wall biosynthesis
MNKDKRIKLLKNKVNRGQFYSRNKAVLSSKGEYVIIVDPDDLL